jgi:hypothetical protein
MEKSVRSLTSLVAAVFMLAGVTANPAMAQEKGKAAEKGKAVLKVLAENDKVRVYEVHFKPGDETTSIVRPFRVVRALKGGTLMRTYADGKTDKYVYKTGEVRLTGPDPAFKGKNVGKTEIVLYVVQPK